MKKNKIFLAVFSVLFLSFVLVLSLRIDRKQGSDKDTQSYSPTADKYNAPNTISYQGKLYQQNEELTTVLFIGVDNVGPVTESPVYYNDGQADFLMLAIFDNESQSVRLLHINRDTMTPVTILGLGGKKAGKSVMQIALSHNYGKGLKDSCSNSVTAVSDLLMGTKIDHYLSMNMDGVALLNDEIGGVTVTIEDEFRDSDTLIKGETVTLTGSDALAYVRGRSGVADGTNVNRMNRQRNYINQFLKSYDEKMESGSFVETSIQLISQYSVTDMSLPLLSSIAESLSSYELEDVCTIDGRISYENTYVEFYPDEEALAGQLAELLYIPVES